MESKFKKGLSDTFLDALERLAEYESWWSDVLADKDLLVAVRNEYVNVYWQGQSLFRIGFTGDAVTASTHPKYLIDPALSKQVPFDGQAFHIEAMQAGAILQAYAGPATLARMKKAAATYSGIEKQGVHTIVRRDPAVVDVEIALSTSGMDEATITEAGKIPRIDIARIQERSSGPELVFWEAKDFGNPELRAKDKDKDAPVVAQIAKYRSTLKHHHADIVASYTRVAQNLVRLAAMSKGHRSVASVVSDVANGSGLHLDSNAVGLVIFGFDAAQRDDKRWKAHLEKLGIHGEIRLEMAGDPKNIRLAPPL